MSETLHRDETGRSLGDTFLTLLHFVEATPRRQGIQGAISSISLVYQLFTYVYTKTRH